MSQRYEMMYILRSDLLEEQVQQEINKYRDFLVEYKAENIQIKNWGRKRLAYPIKKHQEGIYVQMNYEADGRQVAPLERAMRLSDEVIRFLTMKLKKDQPIIQQEPEPVHTPVATSVVAPTPNPTPVHLSVPTPPPADDSVDKDSELAVSAEVSD